ncbi:guanine nucleotide exchange factor for Rab-3A isoform X7 [Pleurodeles waltl]
MDVFEGLHSVDLSPVPSTSLGYDVIKAKDANTAVYTASAFFHQLESRFWPRAAEPESHRREDTVESHHNQSAVKAVGLQLSKQHPLGEWNHSEEVGNHVTAKEEQPPSQTYDVSRLRSSSVEIREKGSEILKEELQKAQKELKLKDRECERLSRVREQLEQELEELTASLFEEAHKMVREANTKQAASEKQLKEAQGKVDTLLFAEFEAWKESPTLDHSCPFLRRIYHEDIEPCLDFAKHELSELVKCAVEKNTLTVEPVASQSLPLVKASAIECGGPNGYRAHIVTKCALSGMSRVCKHRIQLGDSGNYYYISPSCRARITAVCNFFTYIRYIQQGLVRQDVEPMFWEIMRLRKEMSLAKLGFYTHEA